MSLEIKNEKIDNRRLVPPYRPDSEVTLEDGMPDWIKELIMAEIHIRRLTPEGTFAAAIEKLDHYAEMGVNGIWVTPVSDRGIDGNGYGNLGPGTIDPRLTGEIGYDEEWRETDYDAGWKVFQNFLDEAHKRNIRIFIDIVTWGIEWDSKLLVEKPDWFVPEHQGLCSAKSRFYNWSNPEMKEWFISNVVDVALKTDVDGIRFDMEPMYASYAVCKEIRKRIYAAGRKISIISEATNERLETFDFEQFGVCDRRTTVTKPQRLFIADDIVDSYNNGCVPNNIVDCIKTGCGIGSPHRQWSHNGGLFRYYTSMLSCHDYHDANILGSRLFVGYQGIFAPFIPLWWVGEEWINPKEVEYCIYHTPIHWELVNEGEHGAFFEDFKKMIRIRRQFPEIFSYYAPQTRDANICKVSLEGPETIQAYARFAEGHGIIIVPNRTKDEKAGEWKVEIPFEEMGLNKEKYTVTDLWTDTVVVSGSREEVTGFISKVDYDNVGIYLVD